MKLTAANYHNYDNIVIWIFYNQEYLQNRRFWRYSFTIFLKVNHKRELISLHLNEKWRGCCWLPTGPKQGWPHDVHTCGSLWGTWDVDLSPYVYVSIPPEASGCTPAEEEGVSWSIVVMCRETISARVKNASCV